MLAMSQSLLHLAKVASSPQSPLVALPGDDYAQVGPKLR